jgi:hypothetical protein
VTIVTYLHYFRSSILSAKSSDDVLALLRRQNPIQMDDFIKLMFELRSRTPDNLFPPPATGGRAGNVGSMDNVTGNIGGEKGGENTLDDPGVNGAFPLPHGQYPVFEKYPKYVVDFQLEERARIAAEGVRVPVKRIHLQQLQQKSQVLAEQNEIWKSQQEQYLQQEEERLSEEKRKADKLKAEKAMLNKLTEERRLRQIALQQSTITSAMEFEEKSLALEQKKREMEVARRIERESERIDL